VSDNTYVTDKHGIKVFVCNYHWTGPDGKTETCRAPKACDVCGQCSRIDHGGREMGHCTGHNLNEHIKVPGQDGDKAKVEADKAKQGIRVNHKSKGKHTKRPDKRQVKVEHKPQLRKP
jgi:hypothetical protein